jgi:hypothetical protein
MSYRLPPNAAPASSGSDTEDDLDDGCSDWASSLGEARRTKSLFDDSVHESPEAALRYDEREHQFGLDKLCEQWQLDMYGRIRLVNLIRRDVRATSRRQEVADYAETKPGASAQFGGRGCVDDRRCAPDTCRTRRSTAA